MWQFLTLRSAHPKQGQFTIWAPSMATLWAMPFRSSTPTTPGGLSPLEMKHGVMNPPIPVRAPLFPSEMISAELIFPPVLRSPFLKVAQFLSPPAEQPPSPGKSLHHFRQSQSTMVLEAFWLKPMAAGPEASRYPRPSAPLTRSPQPMSMVTHYAARIFSSMSTRRLPASTNFQRILQPTASSMRMETPRTGLRFIIPVPTPPTFPLFI